EQRARATFAFDDKERTNWHFVPLQDPARRPTRKGLPLEDMNATQQQAALALLRAGTSASGDQKALTIMSLENILKELEKGGAMVRNPHWYFFTVFGQPSSTGKWGWRVEGHHLCLNFVIDRDKVVAATPAIFGANPAIVLSGPRKGLRTLPEVEDLARDLIKSLDEDQKKVAHQKEQFPEIQQATAHQDVGPPRGLPASKMNAGQLDLLVGLLDSYAHRMKPDVAEVELGQVKEAGIDNLYFAYAGGVGPGQAHTYRIQGPTFVVEFLNVQADSAGNPANHIHSGWFHLKNDLGVE
ncbi:MAG: DUF3500 domain-containing protein, partial [Planctomycetes bacterium]|nr:DUF3500 domain-containing protein [Planctomycetota bacterium]